ncbi:hypothetical protein SRHO_G00029660 [Serrasalmus rhombeus]
MKHEDQGQSSVQQGLEKYYWSRRTTMDTHVTVKLSVADSETQRLPGTCDEADKTGRDCLALISTRWDCGPHTMELPTTSASAAPGRQGVGPQLDDLRPQERCWEPWS